MFRQSRKTVLAILLGLTVLFMLPARAYGAGSESTVYVKKHVCLLYDDSGSMRSEYKWCYASYAAQTFAALLNDTDTLSIYRMNQDANSGAMEIDLKGDREAQVEKIRNNTAFQMRNTPVRSIDAALRVLLDQGLKKDSEITDSSAAVYEQYWLVLTTDGLFTVSETDSTFVDEREVMEKLNTMLDEYSSLHVIYFGIGGSSAGSARDFRTPKESDDAETRASLQRLLAHANFAPYYAPSPDDIVATMQTVSTQVSGRYSVTDQAQVSGNIVRLNISAESSPIRNIAILAQTTKAKLVSAVCEDGASLRIGRNSRIEYPTGDRSMNPNPLGGYAALIQTTDGKKIPSGLVTLTFSEPVNERALELMYEPAIFLQAKLEKQDASGNWSEIPRGRKVPSGTKVRADYQIFEDGTSNELDPAKLFGKTAAAITVNGKPVKEGEVFDLPEGNTIVNVDLSMMDGAYRLSTSRTIEGFILTGKDFVVSSSGPLELYQSELKNNTTHSVAFSILFEGAPVENDMLSKFTLDTGSIRGELKSGGGKLRFTPNGEAEEGDYQLILSFQGESVAEENIRIKEDINYIAEASSPFSLIDNEIAGSDGQVWFKVTAHTTKEDRPITAQEAQMFEIRVTGEGSLRTDDSFTEGTFRKKVLPESKAGDYTITLLLGGEELAKTQVSILEHDVVYTVKAYVSDPDTFDRIFPEKSDTYVAFILTADGTDCSVERLTALLGSNIEIASDPANRILPKDPEVGTYQGKNAIYVKIRGVKKGFLGLRRTFYRIRAAYNGVKLGEMDVRLTVTLPKGDSAGGMLKATDVLGWRIYYLILPWLWAVIIGLTLWVIFCNIRMARLKPGHLVYYRLVREGSKRDGFQYYLQDSSMEKVRQGFFLKFTLKPQKMSFADKEFEADAGIASLGGHQFLKRYGTTRVSWKNEKQINSYSYRRNGASILGVKSIFDDSIDKELGGTGLGIKLETGEEEVKNPSTLLYLEDLLIFRKSILDPTDTADIIYPPEIQIWSHLPQDKGETSDTSQSSTLKLSPQKKKQTSTKHVKKL